MQAQCMGTLRILQTMHHLLRLRAMKRPSHSADLVHRHARCPCASCGSCQSHAQRMGIWPVPPPHVPQKLSGLLSPGSLCPTGGVPPSLHTPIADHHATQFHLLRQSPRHASHLRRSPCHAIPFARTPCMPPTRITTMLPPPSASTPLPR